MEKKYNYDSPYALSFQPSNATFTINVQSLSTSTVSYDANGGTGTPPTDTTVYADGSTVTVLGQGSMSKAGNTFAGWATSTAGTGTIYKAGNTFVMGATNVTLYAQWTESTAGMPVINFSANPPTVSSGGSTTLTWSVTSSPVANSSFISRLISLFSTNASAADTITCVASYDWTGTKPNSGSEVQQNITSDKHYQLSCSNSVGTTTRNVYVSVESPLGNIQNLTASKSNDCGGKIKLSWTPYLGASNYIVSQYNTDGTLIGNISTSSTSIVISGTATTSYSFTVEAYNASGNALTNVSNTVTATSSGACPNVGGECTILSGTGFVLNQTGTWTVTSSCSLNCSYEWSGAGISSPIKTAENTLNKIYTTLGVKNIRVTITGDGGAAYCSGGVTATTTIRQGGSDTHER